MSAKILTLVVSLLLTASTSFPATNPNVIVILTDDQGALDAVCYGAKDLETPAMDALLTGRYPLRPGLTGNAGSQPGGEGMSAAQITLAEMFKAAGHATAHIGKWRLGYTPDQMPNAQGFDYFFGHMGGCIDNFSHFFYWQGPKRHDLYCNGEDIHIPGRFFAGLMVGEASQFIEPHRRRLAVLPRQERQRKMTL